MGLKELDNIDLSLYIIYDSIERIMHEIEKDYGEEFLKCITAKQLRKYIKERYGL